MKSWERKYLRAKAKQWSKAMAEKFGTTSDPLRTAFVMPDGTQITYRGTGQIHHSGMVRAVGVPATDTLGTTSVFLCSTGAIKLHAWGYESAIEACSHRPTPKQVRVIKDMIQRSTARARREGRDFHVSVDVTTPTGKDTQCFFREHNATADNALRCLRKARYGRSD